MKSRLGALFNNSSLAGKIRYSYLAIVLPLIIISIWMLTYMRQMDNKYKEMIESAAIASEFSLDFKTDFDYETYLVVVGNKSPEDSKLHELLKSARNIVDELSESNNTSENLHRLQDIKTYLDKLDLYTQRIEENLNEDSKYEDNIEIWENDVQIVTALVQENMSVYIYYEISALQKSRENFSKSNNILIRSMAIVYVVIIILVLLLSYYIPNSITRPIRSLCDVTNKVAQGDLSVHANNDEGGEVAVLSESMNSMIDKINELLSQVTDEQIRLRKAEFALLQSQINPHFLYNALDAIVWLAESGDQKSVVHMTTSLSEFFRATLNQGKDITSLKEELTHISSYLKIQQVRYQDILEYDINIEEELYRYHIPKITLQPLVENALYHGIKNKRGKGRITVTTQKYDDYFTIIVSDNGIGITPERLEEIKYGILNKVPENSDIYGLYNVNERIRLNFGEEYGITLESEYNNGTTAIVKLPYT